VVEVVEHALVAVEGNDPLGVVPVLVGETLPSLRLTNAGSCDPTSPATRLGGEVLAGPGFVWPRADDGTPLCLVGQLNCDQINATFGEPVLPDGSLLTFFYDAEEQRAWGFDPGDSQYWKVVVSDLASATAVEAPDGATTFNSLQMNAQRVLTVPALWEPPLEALRAADDDGVWVIFNKLDRRDEAPNHRVFGWPEPMQNPMQLECQLVSNGIYMGGRYDHQDPRVEGLRAGASDWLLLWQIDSDDDVGWMWGDVGTMYYWIRRDDLAAGEFDRVWMVLQG
jgi:uncharacterized protein YwqG